MHFSQGCTSDRRSTFSVKFDERKVDAVFSEFDQCRFPGVAVGIAVGGTPIYRRGFGLASMELPVVLAPTIRMRIASMTKQFTCLAYMLLCEKGRAGIDDSIGTWLPELHPVTRRVTMRQLMGHLGGLRDVHDIVWQLSGTGRPISSTDLLALYQDIDDANAAPGTTWSYNNGGYLLLSAAIERIADRSLEEVLRQDVLEPAGMRDSLLRRVDTDFVPNSATLHMTVEGGGFERSYLGTALAGEAGMVSTIDDMLRWLAHMDVPVVGSASTWALMKTPQRLANGTSTGYGLGLMVDPYRSIEALAHGGSVMGANSYMLKVPAVGLDVVVLANRFDVAAALLARKVLDICLSDSEPTKEASSVSFAVGTYRSPATGRVVQLFAKEGEQIASIDGYDLPFTSAERGILVPGIVASFMKLKVALIGDAERPVALRLDDFGNVDELVAVKLPDEILPSAIAGRYRSQTTGTEVEIHETAEGPRLVTAGRFGSTAYALECLAEGVWRARSMSAMPWGGIVSFDDVGCRFTTARTRRLPLRRYG